MGDLSSLISEYLTNPVPVYQSGLSQTLVNNFWSSYIGPIHRPNYSTVGWLVGFNQDTSRVVIRRFGDFSSDIEITCTEHLYEFAHLHNINLEEISSHSQGEELSVFIRSAYAKFESVPEALKAVVSLVRSVHILISHNPEYDNSYSTLDIPFSIFISIPSGSAFLPELRLAESVLHEAMHLKLSLIERTLPLIRQELRSDCYFSPWRQCERPLGGVLHGLYVFKAIYDFMGSIDKNEMSVEENTHCSQRRIEIAKQIEFIHGFADSPGLTTSGANLVSALLDIGH